MGKLPSKRLLVVRSGQTEWNRASRVQGQTDLPLSAAGRDQILAEVGALPPTKLSKVFTGPDEASVATAEILADATGAGVQVVEDLAEMHLGLWEGMLFTEMQTRYPRVCKQWQEDPVQIIPPEGETFVDAQERILPALTRLIERAKSGSANGVVLRPAALGIVRCWLRESSTCRLWAEASECAWSEWFDVTRVSAKLEASAGSSR